jgi:lipopolysaccharide transport system ATP-binding protein
MSSDILISVEGLGKRYRIRHQAERQRYVSLRDVLAQKAAAMVRCPWSVARGLLSRSPVVSGPVVSSPVVSSEDSPSPFSPLPSPRSEDFWALRDVSFEVRAGEVLGIIGRNGAGKSTLLKILSRITEPTEGRVRIKGRVASLLEVGTGFHPELTGRENIFLNGAILGMTRAEIKRKFDEIVAFAEVEKFLNTPAITRAG